MKKIWLRFFVMNNERGLPKVYFSAFERTVYDDKGRTLECEFYENKSSPPYGTAASAEYYEYEVTTLIKAVKYEDYNTNFKPHKVLFEICPTLIINPYIFEYSFEYSEGSVFCEKKHKYSGEEDNIKRYELNKGELLKLSKYGADCFGI